MKKIWNFLKDENGMELSEYAVMGALLILGITAAIVTLQEQIADTFGAIETAVTPPAQ